MTEDCERWEGGDRGGGGGGAGGGGGGGGGGQIGRADRVPADHSDSDEGVEAGAGRLAVRPGARTRRGRRRAYKPYYALSEGERGAREERERLRVHQLKQRMRAKGRIIAPYNTTQFLMADQAEPGMAEFSFTPADDQDFMCQEFKKDYEVQNLNRLERMTKEMLLSEYIIVERRNERLEERLKRMDERRMVGQKDKNGRIRNLELDVEDKISKLRSEMEMLKMENQRLHSENLQMKKRLKEESLLESGSSSSTDSSSEDEELEESLLEDKERPIKENATSDDNGYESNQSKRGTK